MYPSSPIDMVVASGKWPFQGAINSAFPGALIQSVDEHCEMGDIDVAESLGAPTTDLSNLYVYVGWLTLGQNCIMEVHQLSKRFLVDNAANNSTAPVWVVTNYATPFNNAPDSGWMFVGWRAVIGQGVGQTASGAGVVPPSPPVVPPPPDDLISFIMSAKNVTNTNVVSAVDSANVSFMFATNNTTGMAMTVRGIISSVGDPDIVLAHGSFGAGEVLSQLFVPVATLAGRADPNALTYKLQYNFGGATFYDWAGSSIFFNSDSFDASNASSCCGMSVGTDGGGTNWAATGNPAVFVVALGRYGSDADPDVLKWETAHGGSIIGTVAGTVFTPYVSTVGTGGATINNAGAVTATMAAPHAATGFEVIKCRLTWNAGATVFPNGGTTFLLCNFF